MASDLAATWDDMATHWDDWGPPLRPSEEDVELFREAAARWHGTNPVSVAHVFLCGITPEIAGMGWPFPISLTAMDKSPSMVRVVWPGDIPGVRRARVGNWLDSGLEPGSQHVVIHDCVLTQYDYPGGHSALLTALHGLLDPGGVLIFRAYVRPTRRESKEEVLEAARAGEIGSFHVFKWRLAMALQPDTTLGVGQHDVWQTWAEAAIDPSRLPQPGWSSRAVATIRFYEGKRARFHFTTLAELEAVLAERFRLVSIRYPRYELGERCPVLSATPI